MYEEITFIPENIPVNSVVRCKYGRPFQSGSKECLCIFYKNVHILATYIFIWITGILQRGITGAPLTGGIYATTTTTTINSPTVAILDVLVIDSWRSIAQKHSALRKPEIEKEYLEAFNRSLTRIMSSKNAHVLVGVTSIVGILSGALCRYPRGFRTGEFRVNFWKSCKITAQVVNIHTRKDKTFDLLLTNSPSPVNRVKGMPPIGKADHDKVYVEYDIKAKRIQQTP